MWVVQKNIVENQKKNLLQWIKYLFSLIVSSN